MNRTRSAQTQTRPRQTSDAVDWLYRVWIALVIASTWAFLGAPLVCALASRFTRLRRSRGKQVSIWVIAGVITVFTTFPLVMILLGWSSTQVEETRFIVG